MRDRKKEGITLTDGELYNESIIEYLRKNNLLSKLERKVGVHNIGVYYDRSQYISYSNNKRAQIFYHNEHDTFEEALEDAKLIYLMYAEDMKPYQIKRSSDKVKIKI